MSHISSEDIRDYTNISKTVCEISLKKTVNYRALVSDSHHKVVCIILCMYLVKGC